MRYSFVVLACLLASGTGNASACQLFSAEQAIRAKLGAPRLIAREGELIVSFAPDQRSWAETTTKKYCSAVLVERGVVITQFDQSTGAVTEARYTEGFSVWYRPNS